MRVLVDTCVWSKVLRADNPDLHLSKKLHELILSNRAVLIGPIIQKILSGIKNKKEFTDLKEDLEAFDCLSITENIYVRAAEHFNICKSHGINGSHIDFLICAVCEHHKCVLLTVDSDFSLFEKYLPINLVKK